MNKFPEMPETHSVGLVSIENIKYITELLTGVHNMQRADLGIQIAPDGRVWVCINGRAVLRFKPAMKTEMTRIKDTLTGRWRPDGSNMEQIDKA